MKESHKIETQNYFDTGCLKNMFKGVKMQSVFTWHAFLDLSDAISFDK